MRRGFDGADVPHRNVTAHPEIAVGTFAALLADAARHRISLSRHLLQYVTGRAKASIIMKLRRFTKRLRYRCGRCFANFNRPHPTRRCGLFHGDAASSRVTTTWRDAAITTWQARHFHTRKLGPSFLVPSRGALRLLRSSRFALTQPDAFGAGASRDGHSQYSQEIK